MDKQHNHNDAWGFMALAGVTLYALWGFNLVWHEHRIDSAESRITELELRIECPAPEALFYDVDGNTVCLEPADER